MEEKGEEGRVGRRMEALGRDWADEESSVVGLRLSECFVLRLCVRRRSRRTQPSGPLWGLWGRLVAPKAAVVPSDWPEDLEPLLCVAVFEPFVHPGLALSQTIALSRKLTRASTSPTGFNRPIFP